MADEPMTTSTPSESKSTLKLMSKSMYAKEAALRNLFLLCATAAVAGVALIFLFVGVRGWPIIQDPGLGAFLFGKVWSSSTDQFGILPLVTGTLVITIGALLLGAPLAVGTAVFLSEIASPRVRSVVRPAVELLAGVPSVVYGFFGLIILRPIIANLTGGLGFGPLTAAIILAVMIVPTIATLTEDALGSVVPGIREASYAMGATTWQTIYKVLLPAASVGIIDAIILGMGRAVGETMAVVMVAGNAPQFFQGLGEPVSTLTSQIVIDMSYASGTHRTALFGMAVILFLISMGLVALVRVISNRKKEG
ncbi:MAG: phosphate ABC transporter permease subunit PstC [Coriobacteriia bacterium]|nr:phosphate ABC transporter permease subunit PstC [Coriobacteriia bacterium]MBN2822588.1 phosphate ABC transporter permease subunit PstC [Coriobacteriia bacterium]